MSELPKGSDDFKAKLAEMKDVSKRVKELEAAAGEIEKEWKRLLLTIPNLPDDSVPVGKSAEDNVTVREWGDISKIKNAVPHWDLPQFEKLLDFRRGVKVTGAGFPFSSATWRGLCGRCFRSSSTRRAKTGTASSCAR